MGIKNLSFVMYLAQPSLLDMLVLVGEVRMHAGLHTTCILLHEAIWCAWSSGLASLFHMWRTASSSAQDLSIGVERFVGAGSELLA